MSAAMPKYLRVEVPLSITWRAKTVQLTERTPTTYTFKLTTSRLMLALGWWELAWRILILSAKTFYEPLSDGHHYKVSVVTGEEA